MCLRNGYVRVLKSVSDKNVNVSVSYMPPLANALKLFKCDTDHRFSTKYNQTLHPQHVFGKCIIQRIANVMATTGTLRWYFNA